MGKIAKCLEKMCEGASGGGGATFIDDFEKTPENALKLKAMFESGIILAKRDEFKGELRGVGLVVSVAQEYDDSTGDDCVVFKCYTASGQLGDDFWPID